MQKWCDAESCRGAERHAKTAAAPPIVGTNTRRGRVGRQGGGGWARGGRGGDRSAQKAKV